ncbi:protein kinase, partial [Helicosporidium sp. ATCC 50920]
EEDIVEIQQEIAALRTCRSPHIVQYFSSYTPPGTSQLHIVMELLSASAADLVGEREGGTPLPEPCIAHILRQVLKALAYLHVQGRIHRDVKASNVLLSERGLVKVSDFGVSAQLSGTVGYKRRTFVGSPLWMAPEVIERSPEALKAREEEADRGGYDTAADIWSLGITAIELAQGEPPRANLSSFRLLFMIVREEAPALEGSHFSTAFKDFVWQCLQKDPLQRPTALDLLLHPFVAGADAPPPQLPHAVAAFLRAQRLAAHGVRSP